MYKTRRTRDGKAVRIYATDGAKAYPIHGAIKLDGEWYCRSWALDDLMPEEQWVDATIDDAIRAIRGEIVKCRVRDRIDDGWHESELIGYRTESFSWIVSGGCSWRYCQVLKEVRDV